MTEQSKKTKSNNISKPLKINIINIFKSIMIVSSVLLVLVLMVTLFALGTGAGYFASYVKDEPQRDKEELENLLTNIHSTGEAYFRDGDLIGELRTDSQLYPVELENVSTHLVDAVLAIEDNEFMEHDGINYRGLSRAVTEELRNPGQGTGGSTITQQLVKNQILGPERSMERKFKEMALAMRVDNMFNKEEILESYLNVIYLGFNVNGTNIEGVKAASEGIFDTETQQLNIAQSAYIAGMVHSPGRYTPFTSSGAINESNIERGTRRAHQVLDRMLETQRINQQEYDQARSYDYKQNLATSTPSIYERYPYLTFSIEDRAVDIIIDKILAEEGLLRADVDDFSSIEQQARRELSRGGYKVYTTIDRDLYEAFHAVAADHEFGRRSLTKKETYIDPETGEEKERGYMEQGAATLIDNQTGAILAMLEGRDFIESQINFTNRPFQPGSSVKPILDYAPAFDVGVLQPASVIDDVPIFDWGDSGGYARNYNRTYLGLVTVRESLKNSYNIPAIKALKETRRAIGAEALYEYMQKMGLRHITPAEISHDASAIGGLTRGWTVEDGTAAYSTFANKGIYREPYLIDRIETMDGEIIFEHETTDVQVFSEQTAFLITDMMRDVVNSGTAATVRRGMGQGLDIAGKTGTTNDFEDYWFIGYTPQVSLGLWFGFQERDRMESGEGTRNRSLWVKLLKQVEEVKPELVDRSLRFNQPDNIVQRTVCSKSGKLPSDLCRGEGFLISDYFNRSFVPTETDDTVKKARVIIVDDERYIAHELTPDDFIEEGGIFVKREPLDIPSRWEHIRSQLEPRDWDNSLPQDNDPRELNTRTPSVPQNVRISSSTIKWDSVADSDIAGYRIYRGDRRQNFEHIASVKNHENHEYSPSGSSSAAYYVTAVNIAGQESSPSKLAIRGGSSDPDTFFDPEDPKPPTGLTSSGTQNIQLSWNSNSSDERIEHYNIYVSTGSGFIRLDQTNSTGYQDSPNEEAEYRIYITAVNRLGESDPSNEVTIDLRSTEDEDVNVEDNNDSVNDE